jgi:hypothetical protein
MTRLRSVLRPVAVLCLGAFLAGCYSYVPVERPSPGTTARVVVPLRAGVEGSTVNDRTIAIEGHVLSSGDTLVMETTTRRELGTFQVLTGVDTVKMARSGVFAVEERVFSKPKTVGLTALVTAGAAGMVMAAFKAAGGQRGGGRPGDGSVPTAIRVPPILLRDALAALLGR